MGRMVNVCGYFYYPSAGLSYGTSVLTLAYKPCKQYQGIAQTDGSPATIFLDLKTDGSFCPQPINLGKVACRFNVTYFTN